MERHLSTLLKSSETIIFYRAQTQYDNLGDLIINRILLNKLREHGRVLVDLRGVPNWYLKQLEIADHEQANQYKWKINYLVLFAAIRSIFSFEKQKVYLIEPPGHRYGKLSLKQLKAGLLTLVYYCIFRLIGVRICMFGVSIGPCSQTAEVLEQWRSKLLYFYSVRDSISQSYARQIGIRQVEQFPDLAWLMDGSVNESNNQFNSFLLPQADYVVFSFREQTHNLIQSLKYQQQLYQTLDAIAALVCQTWSKKLVICYQVEMDHVFCQHLAERYNTRHTVLFVKERVDLNSMQSLYGGAFMVFSNRLHVLMLAMAFGSIPIAVIDKMNHHKITGIFQDADLTHLLIDLNDRTDRLSQLSSIAKNISKIRQELATRHSQIREAGNVLFHQVMASP